MGEVAGHGEVEGVVALNVKPFNGADIVKFALDISKKIFDKASTFTLAVVVTTLGIVNNSDPSLGVEGEITVGYVRPPSVDKLIFTLATLNGAAFVPTTFHVIVWLEPPG